MVKNHWYRKLQFTHKAPGGGASHNQHSYAIPGSPSVHASTHASASILGLDHALLPRNAGTSKARRGRASLDAPTRRSSVDAVRSSWPVHLTRRRSVEIPHPSAGCGSGYETSHQASSLRDANASVPFPLVGSTTWDRRGPVGPNATPVPDANSPGLYYSNVETVESDLVWPEERIGAAGGLGPPPPSWGGGRGRGRAARGQGQGQERERELAGVTTDVTTGTATDTATGTGGGAGTPTTVSAPEGGDRSSLHVRRQDEDVSFFFHPYDSKEGGSGHVLVNRNSGLSVDKKRNATSMEFASDHDLIDPRHPSRELERQIEASTDFFGATIMPEAKPKYEEDLLVMELEEGRDSLEMEMRMLGIHRKLEQSDRNKDSSLP